jgi:hypothetical protein
MNILSVFFVLIILGFSQAFASNFEDNKENKTLSAPSLKGRYILTNDVFVKIVLNLSLQDLAHLSEVNKDFHQFFNPSSFKEINPEYIKLHPLAKGREIRSLIDERAKIQILSNFLKGECDSKKFRELLKLTRNNFITIDPYLNWIHGRAISWSLPELADSIYEDLCYFKLHRGTSHKMEELKKKIKQGKDRTQGKEFLTEYARLWNDLELQYKYARLTPKDKYMLNERLVSYGLESALKRKARGLLSGKHGYLQNTEEAHLFIEQLIENGKEFGAKFALSGLRNGKYGYETNQELYTRLYEEYTDFRFPKMAESRISALAMQGQHEEAKKLIEKQVANNNHYAIFMKLWGQLNGLYGYSRSLQNAHEFLFLHIEKDSLIAKQLYLSGLLFGMFGFDKNWDEALTFINTYNVHIYQ